MAVLQGLHRGVVSYYMMDFVRGSAVTSSDETMRQGRMVQMLPQLRGVDLVDGPFLDAVVLELVPIFALGRHPHGLHPTAVLRLLCDGLQLTFH